MAAMRFQPKTPREEVNYDRDNPLREIAILVLAASAIAVAVFFLAGQAIELAVPKVPPSWEVRIFSGLNQTLAGEGGPAAPELQALVDRLAVHWPDCPYGFQVSIDESPLANAFALPGGRILVTRGLLDETESENELAFVLAHELGHFRGRDHLQAIGRAALFASLKLAVGAATGMGAPQGLGWAELLAVRGFSRTQESNADEFALAVIHGEYGHLGSAFDFFRRDGESGVRSRAGSWVSTHPLSGDRVRRLETLAGERGWSLTGAAIPVIRPNNND